MANAKAADPRFAMTIRDDGKVSTRNLNEVLQVAKVAVDAGIVPNDMRDPVKVAVAIMTGAEIGIGSMFAIRNIAIINGRPTIWGDLGVALIQASGTLEDYSEGFEGDPESDDYTAWVRAKRRGQKTEYNGFFSWSDAKRAGLLGKGTYKSWPKDMLFWRARWRCLRKGWADILGGLIPREIISDFPPLDEDRPEPRAVEDFESVSSEPIFQPAEVSEEEELIAQAERVRNQMQADAAAAKMEDDDEHQGTLLEF